MDIIAILSSSDFGSFGLDIGTVLAIVRMTNWVKEYLGTVQWDDKFTRFYWLIPFICAFALAYPMSQQLWPAVRMAGIYGAFATAVFRFWKSGVQGQ